MNRKIVFPCLPHEFGERAFFIGGLSLEALVEPIRKLDLGALHDINSTATSKWSQG
jgi:hypothetical protein